MRVVFSQCLGESFLWSSRGCKCVFQTNTLPQKIRGEIGPIIFLYVDPLSANTKEPLVNSNKYLNYSVLQCYWHILLCFLLSIISMSSSITIFLPYFWRQNKDVENEDMRSALFWHVFTQDGNWFWTDLFFYFLFPIIICLPISKFRWLTKRSSPKALKKLWRKKTRRKCSNSWVPIKEKIPRPWDLFTTQLDE